MHITLNNKFYKINSIGRNKYYYYIYVSEYESLNDIEIQNPLSSDLYFTFELNLIDSKEPIAPQIYNLLLTTDTFNGGILIGG